MGNREDFEKSEHLKERLAICWYDEKIGCYLSIQLCDYASASYLNGAWYAFQEQQKKIDALKAKLEEVKNHAFINYDHERDDDHHSYWSGYNVAMCEFVDIIKGE